ncbi:hypothetical protein DFJ43DRAFT_415292 [Lentinula guzmanii]|uniref:Uncharacterized protein n=1 Tax=Lentinula guzmanii TaxID=2804957 RepID=A0AA38N0I7_9AGAR|nr:hypothetical protein DFJ43DRAFT_415292 [Lentinula guzmanii]KAJ3791952.1 hypothetical protein GGU11DRAFT_750799 [Lentinula aff. detonsa]
MSDNRGGRPKKRKRNIIGLKNQSLPASHTELIETKVDELPNKNDKTLDKAVVIIDSDSEDTHKDLDDCWILEDSFRAAGFFGYGKDRDSEDEEKDLDVKDWKDDLDDEKLQETLVRHAAAMDADIHDEEWIPENLKRKQRRRQQRHEREHKERPKTYAIGPDIAQKSARSSKRHIAQSH